MLILWRIHSKQELWSHNSQPLTRQRHINNNRGMVFSVRSVPMAGHAVVDYVMPSLSNSCTATEEQCYLCGPCQNVINRTS
jgi:hypothetical protein